METSRPRGCRVLVGLVMGFALMVASQVYAVGNLNLELIADPAGPYDRGQEFWVTIKLNTALTAGDDIIGYLLDIQYTNAAVLEYVGPAPSGEAPTCGASNMTYPGAWDFLASSVPSPNTIRLVASGDQAIVGQGCLRRLKFKIKADAPLGECSTLSISNAMFNATTVGGTRTPVTACCKAVNFSGVINFWKNCPSPVPVSCVYVALYPGLTCAGTPQDIDVSGGSCTSTTGGYQVGGQAGVDATLCFSRVNGNDDFKSGQADVAAAITAQDAILILRYLLSLDALDSCRLPDDANFCPPVQLPFDRYPARVAADVDGDGAITPLDSGLIRKVVSCVTLGGANPIACIPAQFKKDWRFFCGSKTYVNPQLPDKTYSPYAVLLGDVNGSYANTALYGKTNPDVTLAVPPVFTTDRDVFLPIELRGNPVGAYALQARVGFDSAVLRFVDAVAGDAAQGLQVETLAGSDAVAVIAYSVAGLDASGTMALLHFERLTPDGQDVKSLIELTNATVGDDAVSALGGVFSTRPVTVQPSTWSQVKRLYNN